MSQKLACRKSALTPLLSYGTVSRLQAKYKYVGSIRYVSCMMYN